MSRSYHITKKKLVRDVKSMDLDIEDVKSYSNKKDLKKEIRWCRENKIAARNSVVDGLIKKLKKAGFTESGEY